MNFLHFIKRYLLPPAVLFFALSPELRAQTDDDGIMMAKKNFCGGPSYSQSSWDHYWEGTFKRNNRNLGTVSIREVSLMGNYGITRKLNVIAGAPYVWTHATAGTLHGQHGIQDISLWLKWMPLEKHIGKGLFSLYALGGGSLPLTNYIADYLPLSIGMHSKTLSGRIMADYQLGKFFVTASGTYTLRSDITIDRNSYYTDQLYLTNRVDMPNLFSSNFRAGYRSKKWIAEGLFSTMTTIGGFDIRKNDMPFPSNKMNAAMAGAHVRCYDVVGRLSLEASGMYTVAGRNVGQSKTFEFGCFYILDFSHKGRTGDSSTPKTK